MEDVFYTAGGPPKGWMHAIFHGGPYGEDIGRCIPGPPAPETFDVSPAEGGVYRYRLWTVGTWSAPGDPIAVYNPDGPAVPPPPLTAQERKWLREGQQKKGLGPLKLVALAPSGRLVRDPDVRTIEAMLAELQHRQSLVLQRLTDHDEGDCYLRVLFDEDDSYELVHQAGTAAERKGTRSASRGAVLDAVLRRLADQPGRGSAREGPEPADGF
ncbi:hypothetical protein ACIQ9R_12275 [Streptomyces sp. NPDC094447]|uniref:hypothetical protein n=1 Tax=Streptomyces sp. NPDC094447 TaxID=3366062 RepID=UPI003823FFDA